MSKLKKIIIGIIIFDILFRSCMTLTGNKVLYTSLATGGEHGGYYDEIILYSNGIVKRSFSLNKYQEEPKTKYSCIGILNLVLLKIDTMLQNEEIENKSNNGFAGPWIADGVRTDRYFYSFYQKDMVQIYESNHKILVSYLDMHVFLFLESFIGYIIIVFIIGLISVIYVKNKKKNK